MTPAQIRLEGGTGPCDGLGTYRPPAWGYAADASAAGENRDGLGSPTGWCAEGTKGALLPV